MYQLIHDMEHAVVEFLRLVGLYEKYMLACMDNKEHKRLKQELSDCMRNVQWHLSVLYRKLEDPANIPTQVFRHLTSLMFNEYGFRPGFIKESTDCFYVYGEDQIWR